MLSLPRNKRRIGILMGLKFLNDQITLTPASKATFALGFPQSEALRPLHLRFRHSRELLEIFSKISVGRYNGLLTVSPMHQ